jgi:predicted glycogen debranching enzyme
MGYIEFDKEDLANLKYSLTKEFIRTNRAGTFGSSTLINCNTRKYHGLLICPMDKLDGENHLLLASLDETIIQHDKEFHLAVRKYPGVVHPGHKYLREFVAHPIPSLKYRVGGVIFEKEMLIVAEEEQVLIKYTLLEANSPTTIKLHPFLAFRSIHALSKANPDVRKDYTEIENGIKTRMYDAYPYLYMQLSKKTKYTSTPDWFFNVQYTEEENRGYDFTEDLFIPGYFEFPMEKGESIIFSASLNQAKPQSLKQKFAAEIKIRIPRDNFEHCLINAAQQFIVRRNNKTEIIAGYPWFGVWGRDTFIALPGLTLAIGDNKTILDALDTMLLNLKDGLFFNKGRDNITDFNSVDASLWFFWTIQQYVKYTSDAKTAWKKYGGVMKSILENYKQGTRYNIKMLENGLIYAGEEGKALTWMASSVNGKPVTPRIGYAVEINALWYNAIMFLLELAKQFSDLEFIAQWSAWPDKIKESFIKLFWSDEKKYLADYVDESGCNWDVRPNQVFACSLPHTMLSKEQAKLVLDIVKSELLTPRGLRTLSPKHFNYIGIYEGDHPAREYAYHQGTVWPWLIGSFCEAWLKIHKMSGLQMVKDLYIGFEPEMKNAGIGTVSEVFDGNPPHEAKGATSQAFSVSELLRLKSLIDFYEKNNYI